MKRKEEKKVGIAVIGCGAIASYHINALRLIPQAEIKVFCDILPERAEAFACEVTDWTEDYRKAICRDDVDLVMVLVPNDLHAQVAVFAASMGKHVFVQKPFARTADECQQIIEAAKANKVQLFASFMHRYFEETRWAKEYIASGGLGEVYMAHLRNSLPGSNYSVWQYDSRRCGQGGALLDVGVHGIDLLRYLLGDIDEILCASKGQKIRKREICGQTVYPDNEDWALVQYRMNCRAVVSHHISWTQKWHCNRYTMEIHGSNGSIYLRTGYGPLAVTSPGVSAPGNMTFPLLETVPFGYRQHKEVIDTIMNEGQPVCGGEDGLYAVKTVEQILSIAKTVRD